jgi:hypothetical protein
MFPVSESGQTFQRVHLYIWQYYRSSPRPHSVTVSSVTLAPNLGSSPMSIPDPELLPIQRPRCSRCTTRMVTTDVSPGPEGFERRSLECLKCGFTDTKMIACDPLKSDAVGWLSGELGRCEAVTHEIHQGRMMPKPANKH